jgi:hypothetical protein
VQPVGWGDAGKGFPTAQVLREMGLAMPVRDDTTPTMAGLLLFGKSERIPALVRGTELVLARFSGHQAGSPIVEEEVLRGNLLHLFERALRFLERYVDLREERPSRRLRLAENGEASPPAEKTSAEAEFAPIRAYYSRGVVLETLVNSLVHRDWGARDRQGRVHIYDDRIEVTNPSLPLSLPMVSIRYGMTSGPNPRLKAIFTNEHYGTPRTSGGVPGLIAKSMAFVRRPPEGLVLHQGEFRVILHGLR